MSEWERRYKDVVFQNEIALEALQFKSKQLNQEKQRTEALRVQLETCRKARDYVVEEDRKGIERIKHLESGQLGIYNQEKQRREDAENALINLMEHFSRYGLEEESVVLLMEVNKANSHFEKYKESK